MRIGIAGAHRTGKTTLAKKLAERLFTPFIQGSATPVYEKLGLLPSDDLTLSQRHMVQSNILLEHKKAISGQTAFITDRTPLDYIAYSVSEINTIEYKKLSKIGVELWSTYIDDCLTALNNFDIVIVVPPSIPIEQDHTKAVCDQIMIDRIHALIVGYADLSMHDRVFVLDSEVTDLDERVESVLSLISVFKPTPE